MYRGDAGWRARIGIVVPSSDTALEPLLHRLAPSGVTFHVARVLAPGKLSLERFADMDRDALRAVQELASAWLDAIVYTVPSALARSVAYERGLQAELAIVTGIPTTTTLDAILRALAALGARRIALALDYPPDLQERAAAFFEQCGLAVVHTAGPPGLADAEQPVPPNDAVLRHARAAAASSAEALVLGSASVALHQAIATIEEDAAVPIVTPALAVLWQALRLAGVRPRFEGRGRLLALADARPGPRDPLALPLFAGPRAGGAPTPAAPSVERPASPPSVARQRRRPRALIVGGSLAGLCAGLAMRSSGFEVEVFERSPGVMQSRGAGLVAQRPVLRLLEQHGIAVPEAATVASPKNQFIDREGRVLRDDLIVRYAISWDVLYRLLRHVFPDEHYHQGKRMVGFEQGERGVVVRFEDGDEVDGDLLIGADGVGSTTRQMLLPEVQPEYAGYVAWRGLVPQEALPPALAGRFAQHFMYYDGPNLQFLTYPVPGPAGEVEPELRRINWVWYCIVPPGEPLRDLLTDRYGTERQLSMPQGFVRQDLVKRQAELARQLVPDLFYQLFVATAEPFIQAIYDLAVPRMAFGRVCLVGDAAFAPRPHAAAATAKAAVDAVELAKALRGADGDIAAALRAWEPVQLEFGRNVVTYARLRGDRLVFGR